MNVDDIVGFIEKLQILQGSLPEFLKGLLYVLKRAEKTLDDLMKTEAKISVALAGRLKREIQTARESAQSFCDQTRQLNKRFAKFTSDVQGTRAPEVIFPFIRRITDDIENAMDQHNKFYDLLKKVEGELEGLIMECQLGVNESKRHIRWIIPLACLSGLSLCAVWYAFKDDMTMRAFLLTTVGLAVLILTCIYGWEFTERIHGLKKHENDMKEELVCLGKCDSEVGRVNMLIRNAERAVKGLNMQLETQANPQAQALCIRGALPLSPPASDSGGESGVDDDVYVEEYLVE